MAMLVLMVLVTVAVVAACLYRYVQTKERRFLTILGLFAIAFVAGLAVATVAVGWLP